MSRRRLRLHHWEVTYRHRHWRGMRGSGPWRRERENRLVAGVAAAVATRMGFDTTFVRCAFVVAALASGFGVAAYIVAWLLIPTAGEPRSIASEALGDAAGLALAAALASLLLAALLIASVLGAGWVGSLTGPLVVSVAGIVLIWRNAPTDEQATLRRLVDPFVGTTTHNLELHIAWRAAAAGALLLGGLLMLVFGRASAWLLVPLGGVALMIVAVVIMLGPWWLRVARDLVVERQARIRAEERADMAARVHDSVLQTLALIQRRADEPQEVVQLARAQERELRSWLFDGRAPGSLDGACTTLDAGIRSIQHDVEAQHRVSVDVVVVGDCDLDDDLNALLAAAREATVNAAKWSGTQTVSIFAEVEPEAVSVFVRDRGAGFDPEAVAKDRKGLTDSIRGRVVRRGGSADIRSAPGEGTEVSLRMPRAARVAPPTLA